MLNPAHALAFLSLLSFAAAIFLVTGGHHTTAEERMTAAAGAVILTVFGCLTAGGSVLAGLLNILFGGSS